MRCASKTLTGTACKRNATAGKSHCSSHSKASPKAKKVSPKAKKTSQTKISPKAKKEPYKIYLKRAEKILMQQPKNGVEYVLPDGIRNEKQLQDLVYILDHSFGHKNKYKDKIICMIAYILVLFEPGSGAVKKMRENKELIEYMIEWDNDPDPAFDNEDLKRIFRHGKLWSYHNGKISIVTKLGKLTKKDWYLPAS